MRELYPFYRFIGLALLLAILSFAWTRVHAQDQHPEGDAAALSLNDGKKWPTDAPLRQGMTRIRDAVQAKLPAIHAGKLDEAGYDVLAGQVNGEIGYIVQNCRLEPKADAMLHLSLADVIAGAGMMEGKQAGTARQAGAARILTALNNYGTYFDHPNWKSPKR